MMQFRGVFPAVVTPSRDDLEVDRAGFEGNLEFLVDAGVNGIVAAGTTGEAGSLSNRERVQPAVAVA